MSRQPFHTIIEILVIDDDQQNCLMLAKLLSLNKYGVTVTHTGEEGLNLLRVQKFDLILCDCRLPDVSTVELLIKIKAIDSSIAIIIINGTSEVQTAVEAFRHGANDYVTMPFGHDELLITIQEAVSKQGMKYLFQGQRVEPQPELVGKNASSISSSVKFRFGRSIQSQAVQRNIELIAPNDLSVIITGETGTGKEYVAQYIHTCSKRAGYPFIAIDCGALPKDLAGSELFGHLKGSFTGAANDKQGSFELADKGTVFLDEIGNLSYENQIKLLRVIQERKIKRIGAIRDIAIDVRIIAATNENLISVVRNGTLREDLYHRLNEFGIQLLPLRERKDDILFFAEYFLKMANQALNKQVTALSTESQQYLTEHYWSGNLRELNNVMKRAVVLTSGECILPDSLPMEVLQSWGSGPAEDAVPGNVGMLKSIAWSAERQAIVDTLERVNYNKSKASELLNIDRKTLYNKLKLYSIVY